MQRLAIIMGVLTLAAVGAATPGSWGRGFRWHGSGQWGPGSPYQRRYEQGKTATIRGKVLKIELLPSRSGRASGVHLRLATGEDKTMPVHLGPRWFIERQDQTIEAGDEVTVSGSLVEIDDKPALIARELRKGEWTLVLRDKEGFPVWSGWRRNR